MPLPAAKLAVGDARFCVVVVATDSVDVPMLDLEPCGLA